MLRILRLASCHRRLSKHPRLKLSHAFATIGHGVIDSGVKPLIMTPMAREKSLQQGSKASLRLSQKRWQRSGR